MATSEASSISPTSKEGDSHNKKVVNLKDNDSKSEQDHASNSNSHKLLDFVKLSEDDSVRGSTKVQELDFFNPMKVGSSSCYEGKDENNNEEKTSESTSTFPCNFCKREFSSSQALGGHQNAHKAERALEKQRRQRINDAGALGHPHFPYYTYQSALSTPTHYRALGVRMESMIQKPPYTRTSHSFGYGHGAMWWQEMLNHSLVRLRNMEGTNSGGGGGANNVGAILQFGDSSTNNVAKSSVSIMDKKNLTPSKDEIHHSNIEEPFNSESSELDLSLKL